VNPPRDQLEKGDDGLMRLRDGTTAQPDVGTQLVSGSLEGSNVNIVDAMVNMIELSRRFELQVKMMKTAQDIENASASIMRMS
jgi:flagellar basal-body rod protein FlgF